MNEYLLLFEDCRIVTGYFHTILYDLTRPLESNYIPSSMVSFINYCSNDKLEEVYKRYTKPEDINIAKEYTDFLLKNEFAFLADEHVKSHMGKLPMAVEQPELVYNSIVCVDSSNIRTIHKVMLQLDKLLCTNVEFRCKTLSIQDFNVLINSFEDSMLESIIIRCDYTDYLTPQFLKTLLSEQPRIKNVTIYKSPNPQEFEEISYKAESVNYYTDCGFINADNFMINKHFFTEGQSCNTCLNKKLSIDFEGNIKNCPSSETSFGNIRNKPLHSALFNKSFKKHWQTSKDEIDVCKDCENRYMCLDCRVFTDSKNRINARPSRCNYNPYIGKWKGEEGYLTLAECGVISNEKEFKIDDKKIAAINQELWGE